MAAYMLLCTNEVQQVVTLPQLTDPHFLVSPGRLTLSCSSLWFAYLGNDLPADSDGVFCAAHFVFECLSSLFAERLHLLVRPHSQTELL